MANSTLDRLVSWLTPRRVWAQTLFLVIWLDPLMLRMHTVCSPVFHCYSCPLATFACPIGVLANFSALHLVPFLAIGTLVVFGAAVGTAVCGWACPFGFLQDLVGKIPLRKITLPNWAGYTRYATLIGLVILVPYWFSDAHALFFCRLCPAGALEGGLYNTAQLAVKGQPVVWPNAAKMTILIAVVAAMLFTWRPFCTLFCPLGVIFGLFNRASVLVLRFHSDTCKGCGGCDKMCRYGVLPNKNVNNSRCIRCLECTRCSALSLGSVLDSTPSQHPSHEGPASVPSG